MTARPDRRLGDPELLTDLGLHAIPTQIGQGHHDRVPQSQDRRPLDRPIVGARGAHAHAQVQDLSFREACSMIDVRWFVSWKLSVVTQFFQEADRLLRRRAGQSLFNQPE